MDSSVFRAVVVRLQQQKNSMNKSTRWMPWLKEPKKDAGGGDTLRGVVNQALIRRFPNGETYPVEDGMSSCGTFLAPKPGTGQQNMHRISNIPRVGRQQRATR